MFLNIIIAKIEQSFLATKMKLQKHKKYHSECSSTCLSGTYPNIISCFYREFYNTPRVKRKNKNKSYKKYIKYKINKHVKDAWYAKNIPKSIFNFLIDASSCKNSFKIFNFISYEIFSVSFSNNLFIIYIFTIFLSINMQN